MSHFFSQKWSFKKEILSLVFSSKIKHFTYCKSLWSYFSIIDLILNAWFDLKIDLIMVSWMLDNWPLQSPSNEWLKVDYLLEFGQWLYSNEFPLQDAIDQLEWAVDIMLNMKTETDLKKEAEAGLKIRIDSFFVEFIKFI